MGSEGVLGGGEGVLGGEGSRGRGRGVSAVGFLVSSGDVVSAPVAPLRLQSPQIGRQPFDLPHSLRNPLRHPPAIRAAAFPAAVQCPAPTLGRLEPAAGIAAEKLGPALDAKTRLGIDDDDDHRIGPSVYPLPPRRVRKLVCHPASDSGERHSLGQLGLAAKRCAPLTGVGWHEVMRSSGGMLVSLELGTWSRSIAGTAPLEGATNSFRRPHHAGQHGEAIPPVSRAWAQPSDKGGLPRACDAKLQTCKLKLTITSLKGSGRPAARRRAAKSLGAASFKLPTGSLVARRDEPDRPGHSA